MVKASRIFSWFAKSWAYFLSMPHRLANSPIVSVSRWALGRDIMSSGVIVGFGRKVCDVATVATGSAFVRAAAKSHLLAETSEKRLQSWDRQNGHYSPNDARLQQYIMWGLSTSTISRCGVRRVPHSRASLALYHTRVDAFLQLPSRAPRLFLATSVSLTGSSTSFWFNLRFL
jgi:hypothetical protein